MTDQTTTMEPTWRKVAEEWQESGQTQKEFAARRGVPAGTLAWWVSRHKRLARGKGSAGQGNRKERVSSTASRPPVRMLPVQVTATPSSMPQEASEAVEVVTARGVRVRVAVGTAPDYVARLVAALG